MPVTAPKTLFQEIRKFLSENTQKDWEVILSAEQQGGQTLKEQDKEKQQRIKDKLSETPVVAAILKTFPGSQVDTFRMMENTASEDDSDDLSEQIDE